jgi:regulator of protease activity HflC (stomatin/prohibitin superfamily)
MDLWQWILLGVAGVVLLFVLDGWFTVGNRQAVAIERLGQFVYMAGAGPHFKWPVIDRIARRLNLQQLEYKVKVETKTKDNVFTHLIVALQYHVLPEREYDAAYKLSSYDQIGSYVFNVVRAYLPTLTLDEVFEKQEEIALHVKEKLDGAMTGFGFEIDTVLLTDIEPDAGVKQQMNRIQAATRAAVAAAQEGEAAKVKTVKDAEAQAEARKLAGKGIADQRAEIARGLKEQIETVKAGASGVSDEEILKMLLMTQYLDTLKSVGEHSKGTVILLPHSPGGLKEFGDQMQQAILVGNAAQNVSGDSAATSRQAA